MAGRRALMVRSPPDRWAHATTEQRGGDTMHAAGHGPLLGLRVLEIGHFVAAPFCTRLLADLGADVIKIEPPGGDPVRQWGGQVEGNSPWWSVHGRNKRSLTLNLKHPEAASIALRLVT